MINFNDLELPIKKAEISGPAVTALAERKEANNSTQASAEIFKNNYSRIRESLLGNLRKIATSKP